MKRNITAHLLVTSKCNLHCKFCLNVWKDRRTERPAVRSFIKDADYFQFLAMIDSLAHEGVRLIVFTGGEPFKNPHLAALVRHAGNSGMQAIIQTNGEGITEGFLESTAGCVRAIQVSLEGTRREHNILTQSRNFSRAVAGMRLVANHGITLMTNFTITTHNIKAVRPYVRLLDSLHVSVASFTRLYPAGHGYSNFAELMPSEQQMAQFYQELARLQRSTPVRFFIQGGIPAHYFAEQQIPLPHGTCGAVISEVAIQPNGDVTMCPSSAEVLGNILRTPLNDILSGDAAKAVRKMHEKKCGGCLLFKDAGEEAFHPIHLPIPALARASLEKKRAVA